MKKQIPIFLVSVISVFVVPSISLASVTGIPDANATSGSRIIDIQLDNSTNQAVLCWIWSEASTATGTFNNLPMQGPIAGGGSTGSEINNSWYATTSITTAGLYPFKLESANPTFRSFGVCVSMNNTSRTVSPTSTPIQGLSTSEGNFVIGDGNGGTAITSSTFPLSSAFAPIRISSCGGAYTAGTSTVNLYSTNDQATFQTTVALTAIGTPIRFYGSHACGGTGYATVIEVPGETGGGSSETATAYLKYPPSNSSSTPIPDWTGNWPTRINNPVPLRTYYEHVRYSLVSSTNPYPGLGNITHEDSVSFVSNSSSSENWPIIKTNILSNFPGIINENGVFEWELLYEFGTDPTFTTILSSSSKHFFVNYFAPDPNTSSSAEAGIMTSTSTWTGISNDINRRYGFTIAGCSVNATATYSVWNPSDWKCMFVGTMYELASSTAGYGAQAVGSAITTVFTNLFPTNIFVTFTGKINEISNPSGIDSTMYFPNPIHPTSTGVVLLSSSTPAWIKTQTGWDFETVVSYLIYLFAGYLVYVSARKAAFMADKNEAHA